MQAPPPQAAKAPDSSAFCNLKEHSQQHGNQIRKQIGFYNRAWGPPRLQSVANISHIDTLKFRGKGNVTLREGTRYQRPHGV